MFTSIRKFKTFTVYEDYDTIVEIGYVTVNIIGQTVYVENHVSGNRWNDGPITWPNIPAEPTVEDIKQLLNERGCATIDDIIEL